MQRDNEPFLDPEYKVPAGANNYFKFQQGENVFRILSKPIMGWEWWTDDITPDGKEIRKPNRVREEEGVPIEAANDEDNMPKHFWAMVVWNYADKKIQILEITQKGIQRAIAALARSKGWGNPENYDISITKSGEKLETEYSVMPIPPAPLDKDIVKKYKETNINLEALYEGKDPFVDKKKEIDLDEIDKTLAT